LSGTEAPDIENFDSSEFDAVQSASNPQEVSGAMKALADLYGVSLDQMIAKYNKTVGYPSYAQLLQGVRP
jgi:hypothetical protein